MPLKDAIFLESCQGHSTGSTARLPEIVMDPDQPHYDHHIDPTEMFEITVTLSVFIS